MDQVEKKKVPPQTVICIEHAGPAADIAKVYHEVLDWAKANGVKAAGQCFTIFLDPPNEEDAGSGRFEVCMPVAAAPKADGKLRVKKLAAVTVAVAQVKGSYDKVPAHYTEMLAWLDAQGWEASGAPREVYLKLPDARGKGRPADFVTEIQIPVAD